LQAVARARQKISSGSMDLQLVTEVLENENVHMETNQLRLSARFDGPKLRWEQVGRNYRYTALDDAYKAQEARMKEEGLDRAAAVREGLLQGFEERYVTAYDGAALLTYRETDGKSAGTVIDEPNKGSGSFIFDPRCLGLSASLGVGSTVESSLAYGEAKSIKLVGKESVDGNPAWHVHVQSKYDEPFDFWIEVAHPARVLKHVHGRDFAVSKYDDAAAGNSIPTEVRTMEYRNGAPSFGRRFIRSNAQFNQPVDPASWTLAGLGMPVGIEVSDNRIFRVIGYWNGSGLSENLPSKPGKPREAPTPPNMAELLALLENNPASVDAFNTAEWILLNTPDGPEVEKAAEVILQEHVQSPDLADLCRELERLRHRCAKKLLAAMLDNNPSAEIKARACFSLATLLKVEAKFGQNKRATAEAEKLFERVTTEFARIGPAGADLARKAKPELYELRQLIIGKPAPETEVEDLDGQKLNISDYRGKVVVLVFWCCGYGYSEAQAHRKLLERMNGKPFALIGVNGDNDRVKAKMAMEKSEITWPCFWDNRTGPIHAQWNVHGWPTVFVLDPKGVIRYRDVRWRELDDAVDTLLRE
jgi:peroxiredoxin